MAEPKHPRERDTEAHDVVIHQTPAKPMKRRTEFLGKKIVATRPSRDGDNGYQLSTIDDQVTIIFEDGGERVVTSNDLFEPTV